LQDQNTAISEIFTEKTGNKIDALEKADKIRVISLHNRLEILKG
jgi:hypothetical protein